MKVTIASWNILNDYWAKHGVDYPLQRVRIPLITKEINKLISKNTRLILFVCELEAENAKKIASETGLSLIGMYEYRRLATVRPAAHGIQNIAFYADKITAKQLSIRQIRTKDKKRDAIAEVSFNGTKIIGTHIPQRPVVDYFTRRAHTDEIISQSPDIVMGDFNATPLFPTRLRFLLRYFEVHRKNRPPFPHKFYLGRNIKSWWPTMNIDVMFIKKQSSLSASDQGYSLTKASDHPLIWAEVEVA